MHWIGLDVSKDTINYAIPQVKKEGSFIKQGRINNNLKGFANLENILIEQIDKGTKFNLACETTGIYSFPVVDYFSSRGWHCNEIHAWKIAKYKQTVLQRNKTDKVDAKEISDYCRRYADLLQKPYISRTAEVLELGFLIRTRVQLMKRDRAFKNIMEAYGFLDDKKIEAITFDYAGKGLEALITANEKYKKNFEKGMIDFCKEKFPVTYECLSSIPGIGDKTIPYLIFYTNDFTRFNNGREFGAYCGLVPNFFESGTSVKYKTKVAHKSVCNKKLRAALSQAANVAMQQRNKNIQCVELAARLSEKAYHQQMIAVCRKLAIQIYYCGKNKVLYSPEAA